MGECLMKYCRTFKDEVEFEMSISELLNEVTDYEDRDIIMHHKDREGEVEEILNSILVPYVDINLVYLVSITEEKILFRMPLIEETPLHALLINTLFARKPNPERTTELVSIKMEERFVVSMDKKLFRLLGVACKNARVGKVRDNRIFITKNDMFTLLKKGDFPAVLDIVRNNIYNPICEMNFQGSVIVRPYNKE